MIHDRERHREALDILLNTEAERANQENHIPWEAAAIVALLIGSVVSAIAALLLG